MESLTDLNNESPKKERQLKKAVERVAIAGAEVTRLDFWAKQASDAFFGFMSPSRSEIVAFLIYEHASELSAKELQRLRTSLYNPIRHLTWLAPQIKSAIAAGDMVRVSELQKDLRSIELGIVAGAESTSSGIKAGRSEKKRGKSPAASSGGELDQLILINTDADDLAI